MLQKAWDVIANLLRTNLLDESAADIIIGQFFIRCILTLLSKQKLGREYEKTGVLYNDLNEVAAKFGETLTRLGAPAMDLGDGFVIKNSRAHDGGQTPNIAEPSMLSPEEQAKPIFVLQGNGFIPGKMVIEKLSRVEVYS